MAKLSDLLPAIENFEIDEKFLTLYRQSFKSIIRDEDPEHLEKLVSENPESFYFFAPLLVGSWFENNKIQEIFNFLSTVDLYGQDRTFDFFVGKLVKYFYLSIKHLGGDITPIYKILCTNREYGNKYTIAIATNSILEYQINSHIYEIIDEEINDKSERCKYTFYLGFIYLVRGDYSMAMKYLDESDILNTKQTLALLIKKCTIVCKLHLGDFSIFYPYQNQLKPYFSLIGCVKRGDVKAFYLHLEDQQSEYLSNNLYFVVRRLLKNIVRVGLRKVAICYSRIQVADISDILGFNVEFILYKAIKDGEVKGFVQDGIFYSQQENLNKFQCGDQLKEVINVRKQIQSMMKYPEIEPLTYEKVISSENK